ncbi:unnamed protein product [Gongylonema pulchrum]|uniref:Secreted protein n=1 Tax=Gongylonema pulchrum TaxID=637853 RepID=A0A183DC91_9BILA|nr:unnamed protein product [Gongylonema pulchrum]
MCVAVLIHSLKDAMGEECYYATPINSRARDFVRSDLLICFSRLLLSLRNSGRKVLSSLSVSSLFQCDKSELIVPQNPVWGTINQKSVQLAQAWRSVSFHRDDGCYWSTATYSRICSNDVLLDYVFFDCIFAKTDAFSRTKLRRDFTSSASEDLHAAVMKK